MPQPFNPLATGGSETCSYPCGNPNHNHSIGCPDVLLSHNGEEEWLLMPVSREGRNWVEEHMDHPTYQDRSILIRGFAYVVELFDGLTDDGLSVR